MAYEKCRRCGRKLKNPLWRKIGYGATCYKKMCEEKTRMKPLFQLTKYTSKENTKNDNNEGRKSH